MLSRVHPLHRMCLRMCMNHCLKSLYIFLLQQFQKIDDDPAQKTLLLAHKRIIEGSATEVYDLSGPWCDVWSLGVMVLQFCLGSPSQEDKTEVQG